VGSVLSGNGRCADSLFSFLLADFIKLVQDGRRTCEDPQQINWYKIRGLKIF
jgi:hypothetical protein